MYRGRTLKIPPDLADGKKTDAVVCSHQDLGLIGVPDFFFSHDKQTYTLCGLVPKHCSAKQEVDEAHHPKCGSYKRLGP